MRPLWLLVGSSWLLGCGRDAGEGTLPSLSSLETLPGIEDACIGMGETDEGIDGTIDLRLEHILAERWERLSSWGEDYTIVEYQEIDERGDLIAESFDYYSSDGNSYWIWSAERDEQGRILVESETQRGIPLGEGTTRTEYTYDGDLLVYTETLVDGDLYQQATYSHDADGRVLSVILEPGGLNSEGNPEIRTSTYLAPFPSLDARLTQDTNGDGNPEIESEMRFNEAGSLLSLVLRDHLFGSNASRTYEYDALGYEIYKRERLEDLPEVHKTQTTRDAQGRALHVEEHRQYGDAPEFLFSRVDSAWEGDLLQHTEAYQWSEEGLVSSEQTTWTWACP